jgi:hypothetical protein
MGEYYNTQQRIPRRSSATPDAVAQRQTEEEELLEEGYNPHRLPSSARRYTPPPAAPPESIYRIPMSDGTVLRVTERKLATMPTNYQRAAQLETPVSRPRRQAHPKRPVQDETVDDLPPANTPTRGTDALPRQHRRRFPRFHWLVWVGLAMLSMLVGWYALTALGNWWQTTQEPAAPGTKRPVKPSLVLVPLVLLCMLAAGAGSYLYLLPLSASATVIITPQARSLHRDVTFPIAANPKAGQVQGRLLVAGSFTMSKTVPTTGHAHDDATSATGVITFYNADSQSYTIPAGETFTTQSGQTIVTDNAVTVQAAVLPEVGIAITSAHVLQVGSAGNIAAHAIYARCCGSAFLTATNTTPFTGGQDARSYSFIQSSDIHNAASDLLASLTPQATTALQQEAHVGEQLVTPLCSPRTRASAEAGSEGASVTVSVTQTCYAVVYRQDSLQQAATRTLAQSAGANLARYEQIGTVQVTVNGSTYTTHTATLQVSLAGVWVYRFTQAQVQHVTQEIAGESQRQARATLERVDGVAQVSIHLQRLDFKDLLPTNPQRISVQFFYIVP